MSFADCTWLNEPAAWQLAGDTLSVTTDGQTDFWRETHYGFVRDSGHLFGLATQGDFTASLRVRAQYRELYDQAGLMVRVDETTWLKAGIEWSDGRAMASSVLTAPRSDWATAPYPHNAGDFHIRSRSATACSGCRSRRMAPCGRSCVSRPSLAPRAIASGRCAARRSVRGSRFNSLSSRSGLPPTRTCTTSHEEMRMSYRMTRVDWVLLPLALVGTAALVYVAFRFLGFLGIGVLGLLTGVVATRVDGEQGWPSGINRYLVGAPLQMSPEEKQAWRADLQRDQVPLFIAKVVSAGMIILGFGLFFLVQLPG